VLWPKAGAPRDVLTTDRNNFRFEPSDKGIEVRALGQLVSGVARYPLGELSAPLAIEPGRFKADSALALGRLRSAPPCRPSTSPETRFFELEKAFSSVIVDGERLPTTSFDIGFARVGDSACMSIAIATTERSRWQVGADLANGTALVGKTEYQRQPASCVMQSAERSSP
jgi:hypothetical protein